VSLRLAARSPPTTKLTATRSATGRGLPDSVQWAIVVSLSTLIPGWAIFKCFYSTGAIEADQGVAKELARSRRIRAAE
ncbi:unnamed protein product, partial [Polarella glacialis]